MRDIREANASRLRARKIAFFASAEAACQRKFRDEFSLAEGKQAHPWPLPINSRTVSVLDDGQQIAIGVAEPGDPGPVRGKQHAVVLVREVLEALASDPSFS